MLTRKLNLQSFSFLIWISLIVLAWEISYRVGILNKAFFASPTEILAVFGQTEFILLFLSDLWKTLARMFLGAFLGILLAYGTTFLALLSTWLKSLFEAINSLLKYLPPPVAIPLALLFFGQNDANVIGLAALVSFTYYLDFLLNQLQEIQFQNGYLIKTWRLKKHQIFRHFLLPKSLYLSHKIQSGLVIWLLGVTIITEIIAGLNFGIGVSLINFQQLYQNNYLYFYVLLLILVAASLQYLLRNSTSLMHFNLQKTLSVLILISITLFSVIYFSVQSFSRVRNSSTNQAQIQILSYKALANLPLMVLNEKFNSEGKYKLEFASSGLKTVDSLLANQAQIAGYSDLPNVLSGIAKNPDFKILSQAIEAETQPALFLVTNQTTVTPTNFKALENQKVGYYPNNPLVGEGLKFAFQLRGTNAGSIDFSSSNDPTILNSNLVAGNFEAVLTIEPFATLAAEQDGILRVNTNKSLLSGLGLKDLPLAGLAVNTSQLSSEQIQNFVQDLVASINYIRENTQPNLQANAELKPILEKYELSPNSQIPAFQTEDEIQPENLQRLLTLVKSLDIPLDLNQIDSQEVYL